MGTCSPDTVIRCPFTAAGALVIVSMAAGDLVSLAVYVGAIVTGEATRMTGSHVYDFFMGAWLNPRIGAHACSSANIHNVAEPACSCAATLLVVRVANQALST